MRDQQTTDMKIGFTGTRAGMTERQGVLLLDFLRRVGAGSTFHHGGAIGADFEAWKLAHVILGLESECYPSNLPSSSAKTTDDKTHTPKPPLDRNRDIVNACDVLIATPEGDEVQRSGTWATVRYARKIDKPRAIIYPDGRVVWEKEVPDTTKDH